MNKRNTLHQGRSIVFVILISWMSFILFINMTVFVVRVIEALGGSKYANEYSELSRAVEDSDYPNVNDMTRSNFRRGAKPMQDLSEFDLLNDYYHLALRYDAMVKIGLDDMADQMLPQLDALEAEATDPVVLQGMQDLRQRLASR